MKGEIKKAIELTEGTVFKERVQHALDEGDYLGCFRAAKAWAEFHDPVSTVDESLKKFYVEYQNSPSRLD